MREIKTHQNSEFTRDHIRVYAVDEPGAGGACHEYQVDAVPTPGTQNFIALTTAINFQHGPLKETPVNGITDEALLAVVEDRLSAFCEGEFPSAETKEARDHIRLALEQLAKRQRDRSERGVAGKSEK